MVRLAPIASIRVAGKYRPLRPFGVLALGNAVGKTLRLALTVVHTPALPRTYAFELIGAPPVFANRLFPLWPLDRMAPRFVS